MAHLVVPIQRRSSAGSDGRIAAAKFTTHDSESQRRKKVRLIIIIHADGMDD